MGPWGCKEQRYKSIFLIYPAARPLHYHKRSLLERFLLFPWSVPAGLWDAAQSRLPHAGLHGRLGTLIVT